MSEYNITVEGGTSKRLLTAGKYCDRDIVVTATGSAAQPDPRDQYQRVEYIESDGSQYVVTDFVADDNSCGIEYLGTVGNFNSNATMGSREGSGDTRFYVPYPLGSTTTYFGFNTAPKITATVATNTVYRWQTNFIDSRIAAVYSVSGAALGSTAINAVLTPHSVPVAIFAINNSASGVAAAKNMRVYSARCSRGHEVVREYIPCYRKADGVIGLYEMHTGAFLTNAGTGSFAKGADVDWEVVI